MPSKSKKKEEIKLDLTNFSVEDIIRGMLVKKDEVFSQAHTRKRRKRKSASNKQSQSSQENPSQGTQMI